MKKAMLFSLFSIFMMTSFSDEKNQINLENKEIEKIEASNEDLIIEKLDLLLIKANEFVYNKIEDELKSDYNAALFEIVWNKEEKVFYVNSIEITSVFPIIPFNETEKNNVQQRLPEKDPEYQVTCTEGVYIDGSNTTTCNGKYSCGTAIYKCLEGGGCASICKVHAAFIYPSFDSKFMGDYMGTVVLTKDKLTDLTVSY